MELVLVWMWHLVIWVLSWRSSPEIIKPMILSFKIQRLLHINLMILILSRHQSTPRDSRMIRNLLKCSSRRRRMRTGHHSILVCQSTHRRRRMYHNSRRGSVVKSRSQVSRGSIYLRFQKDSRFRNWPSNQSIGNRSHWKSRASSRKNKHYSKS